MHSHYMRLFYQPPKGAKQALEDSVIKQTECPLCTATETLKNITCVYCGKDVKPSRAELIETLRYVLDRIDNLDHWWINVPSVGGFDVGRIVKVLRGAS